MIEVILTFYGLGKCEKYQVNINFFNSCNKLIFSSIIRNGKDCVWLPINQAYAVLAIFQNQVIISSFYVDCMYNKFMFFFK